MNPVEINAQHLRPAVHCRSILKMALAALLLLHSAVAMGQSVAIQDLLAQKEKWPTYAADGKKLQFEGRFEGRTATTIRIIKFDIICNLPSNATFPDGIRNGQRIDVIGRFASENGRLSFGVSRILIKDTDIDRLRLRAKDVPADQPAKLLDLAAEYQADAEFYDDSVLKAEITAVRTESLSRLRGMARGDVTRLREILKQSKSLGVKPEFVESLQFESIYAASIQPNADVDALAAETKLSCDGWDQLVPPIPERLRSPFAKNAVATFLSAQEADRRALHRLLYQSLRLRQIQTMVKSDGSNGLEISNLVRSEFGDDNPLAADFEERYFTYRRSQLATDSRSNLKGLTELLTMRSRAEQVPDVMRDWLLAQERKFGNTSLAGLLRMADEYLFAADLMPSAEYELQGVELLKRAWGIAIKDSPTDADQIADRLRRLGWERLNEKWMTIAQMKSLPKDDVQLAIREGRVVGGMSAQQVVLTLGQPTRISRIASRKSVCELWNYDEEGSAGMVIRFRRSLVDTTASSIVEDVSRISARRVQ